MTQQDLKSLLDKLNKNKTNGLVFVRPLSATVDFAKVWLQKPKPIDKISYPDGPCKFYFIKNEIGIYTATVFDMGNDLHWFVDKKFRGQGYLTKAMQQTILPHLFQDREKQNISIKVGDIGTQNARASEKVATSLGFVKLTSENFTLTDYQQKDFIKGQNTSVSLERIEELKKHINYLSRSLWIIHSELEMKLGNDDYAEDMKEVIDEMKDLADRLEDAWWESKNSQN